MNKNTTKILLSAAVAGIVGSVLTTAAPAFAADNMQKGHCVGANSCKGHGGCSQPGVNDCAGKNSCKGKGFVEKTKAQCDKLAKKNKKIHFEEKS